jgi:3-hydroxyisobutyrate dehydrogenase-like beta-hydroxyacid dehydrogenase
MGTAIAERIEKAGHQLTVWNRSPAKIERFRRRGVQTVHRPEEAWEYADVCISVLSDSRAVEYVATGEIGLLTTARGGVYIDMSTIAADASARIAEVALEHDVAYLRAPVSGNPAVAAAGNLGIIVSGPRETYDAMRDVLAAIGPNVFFVGEDEQARIVKLAINLMLAGTAQLMAEALVLGERYAIDRQALLEVIGGSAIGSPFVKYKTDALVADDYTATFTTDMLHKDLALAIEAADDVGVPLPLTAVTQELTEECISLGMGDIDFLALVPRLRRAAGLAQPRGA